MSEPFLDLKTVAEQLGCHIATLLKAIEDEELTAIKGIGRGYRTRQSWVDAYVAHKTVNPQAAQMVDRAGGE